MVLCTCDEVHSLERTMGVKCRSEMCETTQVALRVQVSPKDTNVAYSALTDLIIELERPFIRTPLCSPS